MDPLIKNSWIRPCVPSRDPFCQRHLIRGRIAWKDRDSFKNFNSNFYISLTHNVTGVTGILVVVVVVVLTLSAVTSHESIKENHKFLFPSYFIYVIKQQ